MIDFDEIPQEQVIARGQYSIVRQARENMLKELRRFCEENNSVSAAVIRDIQEGRAVQNHLLFLGSNLVKMDEVSNEINALTRQMDIIRPIAFP